MPLLERKLKFFCAHCRENDYLACLKDRILDKKTIINDKQLIIDMLREKIQKLETAQSYASIASTAASQATALRPVPKNIPPLLIKPKNPQEAEVTKKELQKKVNPRQLNISINSVRTAKNGVVIIKCNTEQETQKLMDNIKSQDVEGKYSVELPQMKKPRFKIVTSATGESIEDITNSLRQQNQFIQDEDYLKITYIKANKNNKCIVFGECSGDLFGRFMSFKRVFISWERCPVYEDSRMPRCKICFSYDHHKEVDCQIKKITCTYCSGEHEFNQCPKTFKKCCNCSRSNAKYNLKHNTNHEAFSLECPTYKFYMQRYKGSIDYYSM